jgi:nicotinamide mononucleotide transporter PnuC
VFFGVRMKNPFSCLNKKDWALYISSLIVAVTCNFFGDRVSVLNLVAVIFGMTALIFIAKGNVWGQVFSVLFGTLYSITAIKYRYYSEIITYLGMTAPIGLFSIFSWLKNPYKRGENVVKIRRLTLKEFMITFSLTIVVTVVFYFILKALGTKNLIVSTVSITMSFLASILMLRRISYYAIVFMLNDVVLIILWILACFDDLTYLSMVACFFMFLFNDLYAFVHWKIREKQQGLTKKREQ